MIWLGPIVDDMSNTDKEVQERVNDNYAKRLALSAAFIVAIAALLSFHSLFACY